MRIICFLLAGISAYCGDLIYLSDNTSLTNLEGLNAKYQQPLLLSNSAVYLIPNECKSERYFGGASEGILNILKGPLRTETVLTTQEVFEAKDEKQIIKKIELDKMFAIAEGKITKDFLEDKEGRGFGGASEIPLVIQNEIAPMLKVSDKGQVKEMKTPACHILDDGSGYRISEMTNGRLYMNGKIIPIINDRVFFQ